MYKPNVVFLSCRSLQVIQKHWTPALTTRAEHSTEYLLTKPCLVFSSADETVVNNNVEVITHTAN